MLTTEADRSSFSGSTRAATTLERYPSDRRSNIGGDLAHHRFLLQALERLMTSFLRHVDLLTEMGEGGSGQRDLVLDCVQEITITLIELRTCRSLAVSICDAREVVHSILIFPWHFQVHSA